MSGEWTQYKEEQKERRVKRLPTRTAQILALTELGYKVEKKTDYCYRINDTIDLYPIHVKWHNIKKNKRGGYRPDKLIDLLNIQLNKEV